MELTARAIEVAEQAHDGQKRDGGEPFLVHPLRVATHLFVVRPDVTEQELAVAILHDVLEDSPEWDRGRLAGLFGESIAATVDALSKSTVEKSLSPDDYKQALLSAPHFVRVIKLCDRLDNIISLRTCPEAAKVQRYYAGTTTWYRDIAAATDEKLFEVIADEIASQGRAAGGCGKICE